MVASKASHLGYVAAMLLGRQMWASGQSSCTSVEVSGIGELDGTYTDTPSSTYDHYYYRPGGYDTYIIIISADTWYIQNDNTDLQYATNDPAQHPADISLEWVECVGFLCSDDPAASQPVITCVDDPPEVEPSTCTSVTVSRIGELDGTYTDTPSSTYDHYYYRAGGSDTYTITLGSSDIWYIQNDDTDLQYAVNDLAQHPVDITLEWAECFGFLCNDEPAVSQPVITCEGDTIAPTPSAPIDEIETPSPTPASVTTDDPASGATPAPVGTSVEPGPTPVAATPAPVPGPVEGNPTSPTAQEGTDTGGGDSSNTTQIVIGVVSTVVGGIILAIITKYCIKQNS